MNKIKKIVLVLAMMLLLCACSNKSENDSNEKSKGQEKFVVGTYIYNEIDNKDTSDSIQFSITFKENGTYEYVESVVSSSPTSGKWEMSNKKLVLSDVAGNNYFEVKKDKIIFASSDSDNFRIVKLRDGDEFIRDK